MQRENTLYMPKRNNRTGRRAIFGADNTPCFQITRVLSKTHRINSHCLSCAVTTLQCWCFLITCNFRSLISDSYSTSSNSILNSKFFEFLWGQGVKSASDKHLNSVYGTESRQLILNHSEFEIVSLIFYHIHKKSVFCVSGTDM